MIFTVPNASRFLPAAACARLRKHLVIGKFDESKEGVAHVAPFIYEYSFCCSFGDGYKCYDLRVEKLSCCKGLKSASAPLRVARRVLLCQYILPESDHSLGKLKSSKIQQEKNEWVALNRLLGKGCKSHCRYGPNNPQEWWSDF